jgi:hypothetical protein
MMLDAETVVEAEFIAELELAPQFLVAPSRCHSRLGPDVGKMSELHEGMANFGIESLL